VAEEKKKEVEMIAKGTTALKDFHLNCPPHIVKEIKKGDDLSKVPKSFLSSLRTEGVIAKK